MWVRHSSKHRWLDLFLVPLSSLVFGGQVLSVLLSTGFPWLPTWACLLVTLNMTLSSPLSDL